MKTVFSLSSDVCPLPLLTRQQTCFAFLLRSSWRTWAPRYPVAPVRRILRGMCEPMESRLSSTLNASGLSSMAALFSSPAAFPRVSMNLARASGEGLSKTFLYTIGKPAFMQLSTSLDAEMDVPPISKKSSSAYTFSRPRTPANISHSLDSTGPDGSLPALLGSDEGSGSLLLSTLPLTVIGMESSWMKWAGTMYGGLALLMKSARPLKSTGESETTYAVMDFPPAGSSNAFTVASFMS